MTDETVVSLLRQIDGQLGLAIYRGEGIEQQWKDEAKALILRIRKAVAALEADHSGWSDA